MITLTPRQQAIYDWMLFSFIENRRPPSFRDVARQFQIGSTNTVSYHIHRIANAGLIDVEPRRKITFKH